MLFVHGLGIFFSIGVTVFLAMIAVAKKVYKLKNKADYRKKSYFTLYVGVVSFNLDMSS